MSLREILLQFLFNSGFLRSFQKRFPNYMTVLNYHRIGNYKSRSFDTFKPNISASPESFHKQIELMAKWFNVVTPTDVVSLVKERKKLPPYAALITFDDGYFDNYQFAIPVLNSFRFPALIFLTTGHISTGKPFYWDVVAYCFYHTNYDYIKLPLLGEYRWDTQNQLDRIIHQIAEKMKNLPGGEISKIVDSLPNELGIDMITSTFRGLMMDWNQVRELSTQGIEFGGHTITHPILSRVDPGQVKYEIEGSKAHIEKEIGKTITAFAYPNGMRDDFDNATKEFVRKAGYQIAFSLIFGSISYKAVQKDPFEIKRIFISRKDSLPRFAVKISGIKLF